MGKLKLEYLVTALQHRQKLQYFDDERELNQICEIVELRREEMTISNNEYQYDVEFDDVKPILFPLDYLTKYREDLGFMPIEYEAFERSKEGIIEFQNKFIHYKGMKYVIIQKLQEWKFDIHGLIEKNLAIAVTEEFNPYLTK